MAAVGKPCGGPSAGPKTIRESDCVGFTGGDDAQKDATAVGKGQVFAVGRKRCGQDGIVGRISGEPLLDNVRLHKTQCGVPPGASADSYQCEYDGNFRGML